ncbi:hypothetical protein ACFSRY_02505 [Pontibacter locisalis]|uniref:Tetratricopeptide repeat protein n=1 Tax=Pontibacter locisalis TaxID=1719035 RepID=A0ABW5IIB6_9BACT
MKTKKRHTQGFIASLLILFLALLTGPAFAETPDYTKVYHPIINEAEKNILQKDYQAALAAYQLAFSEVPSPFARDYYNAAVCALLTKDEKLTYEYLEKLVLKGVSLPYLEKQQAFEPLHKTRKWKKFKRKYPKYRKAYNELVNLDLRADLDELYARDAYFRQAKGGYGEYGDTLRKIEVANTKLFLKWVEEFGYPGESLIGVADTLEQLPRFYIVVQRQTKARKGHDFSKVLTEAVEQGKLGPQVAAYLLEQQAGDSRYSSKAFVKVNCNKCKNGDSLEGLDRYFEIARTEEELKAINKRRAKLGLDSLKDYKEKVLYSFEDTRFKLGNEWAVTNYYVPSKEAAEIILEKLVAAQ